MKTKQNLTEEQRARSRAYSAKRARTLKCRLSQKYHDLNARCTEPNHKDFHNYGGRGIQNMFLSFADFYDYVVNELHISKFELIENLDIDRIDNNRGYQRGNVRFVSHRQNMNNTRRNSRRLRLPLDDILRMAL